MTTVLFITLLAATPAESSAAPGSQPSGWLLAGGILGATTGAGVLGLAVAGEQLKLKGNLAAVPLGISVAALGAVVPPLVFLAGWAGRRSTKVRGAPALRWLAWIAYGGGLLAGAVAAGYALSGTEPIHGSIALSGGLTTMSLWLLAADAFVTWHQAQRAHQRVVARQEARWFPWFQTQRTSTQGTVGLVGVSGRF